MCEGTGKARRSPEDSTVVYRLDFELSSLSLNPGSTTD